MGKIEELEKYVEKLQPVLQHSNFYRDRVWADKSSLLYFVGEIKKQLKSSLPTQQDKVVVPEFVAEYIKRCKRADSGLIWSIRPDRDANDNSAEVYDWLFPNGAVLPNGKYPELFEPDNLVRPDKQNQILFARAWLDGYTVEKEQLYWIYDPNADQYLGYDRVEGTVWWLLKQNDGARAELTDAEISNIGKQYKAFAVPVEEDE